MISNGNNDKDIVKYYWHTFHDLLCLFAEPSKDSAITAIYCHSCSLFLDLTGVQSQFLSFVTICCVTYCRCLCQCRHVKHIRRVEVNSNTEYMFLISMLIINKEAFLTCCGVVLRIQTFLDYLPCFVFFPFKSHVSKTPTNCAICPAEKLVKKICKQMTKW